MDLSYNLIENISVLNRVPFINLERLKLSKNKIKNFGILTNSPINNNKLYLDVDQTQNYLLMPYILNLHFKITINW